MIIVNVTTSVPPGSIGMRRAACGPWKLVESVPSEFDGLLAIRDGYVVGAYRILSRSTASGGQIVFRLEESSRLAFLLGRPGRPSWSRGDRDAVSVDTPSLIVPGRGVDELTAARWRRRGRARGSVGGSYRPRARDYDRPRAAGMNLGDSGGTR